MKTNIALFGLCVTACVGMTSCDDDDFRYNEYSNLLPGVLLNSDGSATNIRLEGASPEFTFYYDNYDGHLKGVEDYDRYYYRSNNYNNRLVMTSSNGNSHYEEEYEFGYYRNLIAHAVVVVRDQENGDYWNSYYDYEFDYTSYGELRRISCVHEKSVSEKGEERKERYTKQTYLEYNQDGSLRSVEHKESDSNAPRDEYHRYKFDNSDADYNLYRVYTPTIMSTIFGDYKKQSGLYGLHAMAMLGYFGSAPMYLPWEVYHEWELTDNGQRTSGYEHVNMRYKVDDKDLIYLADGCDYRYELLSVY